LFEESIKCQALYLSMHHAVDLTWAWTRDVFRCWNGKCGTV